MTTAPAPPEHDERLRRDLTSVCNALSVDNADDLVGLIPTVVRARVLPDFLLPLRTANLLLILHAAALRAPDSTRAHVLNVADAAREAAGFREDQGCRDDCDQADLNRTGLACQGCTARPQRALEEAVTELVWHVQRETSPNAFDAVTE